MIIYKATNNINGKVYIGQTIRTLEERKYRHLHNAKNNPNYYFARALNKYGKESFYWTILNECNNIDLLNQLEKYYISCYKSMNKENGYNLTSGGLNFIMSEESKQKMRETSTGKNSSMFGKLGKDNPNYGRKHSEETKQKMREAQSGEKHPNFGKHHSKKTKQKISDSSPDRNGKNNPMFGRLGKDNPNYGRILTEETKQKIRDSQPDQSGEKSPFWGKRRPIETIEKMRLARKKYWEKQKSKIKENDGNSLTKKNKGV